ncbi:MAG: DegV family protein [Clostridia bacterium]|nr:DegV family protein [Clostridia bacterium]
MKIKITTDSTCDLSKELLEQYNITILPLYVVKGGEHYKDFFEIDPDDVYAHVAETGEMCSTAALSIGDYIEYFKPFAAEYDAVIHINISQKFSCCYQNAQLAAQEFDNVYVVDSRNLSTGHGHVVLEACQLAQQGMEPQDICCQLSELTDKVDASFILNRLDYLAKGGRCSAVAALGANLLKLKVCIEVKDGGMGAGKKYRGAYDKCMVEYITERLSDIDNIRTDRVFITHSGLSEELIAKAVAAVKKCGKFENIYVTRAGCVISNHCGENTMGVLFIRK